MKIEKLFILFIVANLIVDVSSFIFVFFFSVSFLICIGGLPGFVGISLTSNLTFLYSSNCFNAIYNSCFVFVNSSCLAFNSPS